MYIILQKYYYLTCRIVIETFIVTTITKLSGDSISDIMAKDSVGVIYGRTGSFTFEFAVPEHVVVKRGEYIKVWHDIDGWTLAQVDGVMRMSDTFQLKQAIDAAEGARTGSVNEKTTAKASVIGFRGTDRLLRTPKTPFSPGDKVFRADEEIITYTLGLIAGDVYLGLLDGQKVRVYLNGDDLVQKHVSVLAKTGSGKSYTAAVILEELLDNGIPMLIIDPHGEYLTLKQPNDDDDKKVFNKYKIVPKGYERQVTVYTPADKRINPDADRLFRLNETNLTTSDLSQLLVEDQTQNQTAILYEAINKLKAEDCNYSVEDIILELGQNKSKSKWNLISAIERIKETGLFSKKPTRLEELIKPGHASIIDMKGVDPDIQRPARVDKNVLSQCNTQIIMKVTNANDLKALSSGLEGLSSGLEEEIKRLPAGVAMIVSNKIERPILVDVRVRKSKHGGTSAAIERGFSYIEDAPPDEHTIEVLERNSVDEAATEKDMVPEILVNPRKDVNDDVYIEMPEKRKEKSLFKKIFGSSK